MTTLTEALPALLPQMLWVYRVDGDRQFISNVHLPHLRLLKVVAVIGRSAQ